MESSSERRDYGKSGHRYKSTQRRTEDNGEGLVTRRPAHEEISLDDNEMLSLWTFIVINDPL